MKTRSIKKVLIVHKRSLLQKFVIQNQGSRMAQFHRRGHELTQAFDLAHQQHQASLKLVEKTLQDFGLIYRKVTRKKLASVKGYDLVVTVGGDGTFLKTSHFIRNELLLGINSAPSLSVGALCSMTAQQFAQKLPAILKGRVRFKKIKLLDIKINGKKLKRRALNDILLANNSPAAMSRYVIKVGRHQETQRSSGVWLATPAGSTAAIYAAGGKKMAASANQFQYLVREPYRFEPQKDYRLIKGLLSARAKLVLTNQMIDASLFVDGTQYVHDLQFGDQITVSLSQQPIHVIC